MKLRLRASSAVMAVMLVLSACTAFHNSEPYLPQRSGVVPGEVITVGQNQNIYGIAQDHGVSMRDLIVLNGLQQPFALKPGQTLVLPYKRGDVQSNVNSPPLEPLSAIETQTLPPPQPASEQKQNREVLGATIPSIPLHEITAPAAPAPKPVTTTMAAPQTLAPSSAPASTAAAPTFSWPVQGPVLSGFGPKGQGVNNDGVNIGAPKGSPVVAAANGIVVYAGNEMKGFGNMILIRHENGWVTAYAHLDRVLVAKDAVVAEGDMIGTVGKTGNIASPQLHFETRHDGKAVDPSGLVK